MKNKIQHYPWGSTSAIPKLLGVHEDGRPWAEMWMGAHPRGPSVVINGEGREIELSTLLEERKEDIPFLFKVLAAGEPLSIQAHPNKKQAEEGFDREEAAEISSDAAWRNYRDRNHKPEIIVALTEFTALCGFRSAATIGTIFSKIASTGLIAKIGKKLSESLTREGEEKALESFLDDLLTIEKDDRKAFCRSLATWARENRDESLKREAKLVARFYELHPEDPAIASPLYLNIVNLKPKEALFQPAGLLHAYVEGTGIELMANSDNVLRGGLTKKHMDVEELKKVLIFQRTEPEVLLPRESGDGLGVYDSPVDEFQLCRFEKGEATLSGRSPAIALVVDGAVTVSDERLGRGESVYLPSSCPFTFSGSGTAFIARLPDSDHLPQTRL